MLLVIWMQGIWKMSDNNKECACGGLGYFEEYYKAPNGKMISVKTQCLLCLAKKLEISLYGKDTNRNKDSSSKHSQS